MLLKPTTYQQHEFNRDWRTIDEFSQPPHDDEHRKNVWCALRQPNEHVGIFSSDYSKVTNETIICDPVALLAAHKTDGQLSATRAVSHLHSMAWDMYDWNHGQNYWKEPLLSLDGKYQCSCSLPHHFAINWQPGDALIFSGDNHAHSCAESMMHNTTEASHIHPNCIIALICAECSDLGKLILRKICSESSFKGIVGTNAQYWQSLEAAFERSLQS